MKMKHFKIILTIVVILVIFARLLGYFSFQATRHSLAQSDETSDINIKTILENRQSEQLNKATHDNPFGEDGRVNLLLIGLDNRAGETAGHCDAIQFVELNQKTQTIRITAVPRGTYSPLPPGLGTATGDYYISNACGLVGLEYGIDQIEKVVGQKADYLAIVGFSRALGIIRELKLPPTETLQWLRQRQGYAIGEPQRAHNHSTFLKQMLIKFTPDQHSNFDLPFHYLLYNLVQTDLSFTQARTIIDFLTDLELTEHPERISLDMKPAYSVREIDYVPEQVEQYVSGMITPIKNYLSDQDYSGISQETSEKNLLAIIEEKQNDPDFIRWAYNNKLWLQLTDEEQRSMVQFSLTSKYAETLSDLDEQVDVLGNYILEMEYRERPFWSVQGQKFLDTLLLNPILKLFNQYHQLKTPG